MFDGLVDLLFGWVFDLIYLFQSGICVVVDFIVITFYKLSGLENVTIDGNKTDLLSHFIETPAIRTAFFGVFLVGVILLFVFVLIAIIRSEYADAQHKRTKGQILVKAGQSFIIFLIIPFLLSAGILLTNAVMSAIDGSMQAGVSGSGKTTFGGQILVTSGYEAYAGASGARAEIERKFISGELDYANLSTVKKYYDLQNVNFFVGIFSGLTLAVMFALAALRFVQRLFDVILLYVVSPVSVATIPLDDGARMKLWREMLISKVLSAYGIILAMNLFFLIVPQISRIKFFDDGFQNGLMELLFIIGGAFSVTKAYMVIAQLTGGNAGMQETQQALTSIYSGVRMARGAARLAAGAVGQIIGGNDFRSNRRKGMGFAENVGASMSGTRNRRGESDDNVRRGNSDGDKEQKSGQAPAGDNRRGNDGGSPQGARTLRENDAPWRNGGVDNGTGNIGTDGGRSQSSDVETERRQAGKGQASFADRNDRRQSGADGGEARSDTYGARDTFTHGDGARCSGADNAAFISADGGDMQVGTGVSDGGRTEKSRRTEGEESADGGGNREKTTAGQKAARFLGGMMRLSNLPVGVLKDLVQGGVITAGKNIWPRLRNVAKGRGVINHAEFISKPLKDGAAAYDKTDEAAPSDAKDARPMQVKPNKRDGKNGGKEQG
ncbi:MAG: hypothetical protein LBC13_02815 [Clostridiales bacterium]|jgi:hypothetical protein|nr:hypothetical protein [Clostridiales bacterium]